MLIFYNVVRNGTNKKKGGYVPATTSYLGFISRETNLSIYLKRIGIGEKIVHFLAVLISYNF